MNIQDLIDKPYMDLIDRILTEGTSRQGRNGDTLGIFGHTIEFDMAGHYLPLLLTRRIYYRGIIGELAAMLKQPKTVKDFEDCGCNYWNLWGDENGNLEVDYGNAWFDYNGVNQIQNVIDTIKTNPHDRRLLVNAWRPDRLDKLSLPCCHYSYQWYVEDDKLHMIWNQRSVDVMIGLPSDFLLAAALNLVIAGETGLKAGKLIFNLGDCHIYAEHLLEMSKYKRQYAYLEKAYNNLDVSKPRYMTKPVKLEDFDCDSVAPLDYYPMDPIKFELKA